MTLSGASGVVTLSSGDARVTVATLGAELQSFTVAGHELLWSGDEAFWSGRAPILFPVVGWCAGGVVRVSGTTYPMDVHGFAARARFTCTDASATSATFVLVDDEGTRRHFPFAFRLTVTHRLEARALVTSLEVENTGESEMPYAVGLHPGFRWPLAGAPRERHRVVFEREERASVPIIAPGGLFSAERRPVPLVDGRVLSLSDALLAKEALVFLDTQSRVVRFEDDQGTALTVTAEELPHFALWSRPGAGFVCLEHWTGHGDPVGFGGDLFAKPSMRVLSPEAKARHAARYEIALSA